MTLVIAQHCGLLPFGWMGVWLFYVISGYVIALGFEADEGLCSPLQRLAGFWQRRAARLLPAYLAYLLINVLVLLALQRPAPLADLPWLLGFMHNAHMALDWGGAFSGHAPFGHLWTLSVEQQFYLVFPLLMLALPAVWRPRVLLLLVCAGPAVRALASASLQAEGWPPGRVAFAVYAGSITQFDAFLMGALLAAAVRRGLLQSAQAARCSAWLWCAGLAGALMYAAVTVGINVHVRGQHGAQALRDVFSGVLFGQGREIWVYSVVALLSTALLLQVLRQGRGTAWLARPAVAAVGRASYSGYLLHLLLLWALGELAGEALGGRVKDWALGPRVLALALVWGGTVLLSRWSLRWLEQPGAAWLRRPFGPGPAAPVAARQGARA